MPTILIVDKVHPMLAETLGKSGFDCRTDRDMTYDKFIALPDNIDGLVIRSRFEVDKAIIDSKPHLRFIIRMGSGMENIDTQYAENHNIRCHSTPDGNAPAVAEHCLALLLSALRHIPNANNEVRRGEWLREVNKGTELGSQRVGIIGYGHTGPAFARLLKALGCDVICHDRYKQNYGDDNAKEASLDEILSTCSIISLHINYTPENHHFINKELIEKAQRPFIFINSSRGSAVNTADLIDALDNGKISCACLDVLEFESTRLKIPPKEQWPADLQHLAKMGNVILTPHVGGQTLESELRHAELAVKIIQEYYQETI